MKDRDDTSAQGYFTYADSYLHSASVLIEAPDSVGHQDAPIRLLLFHSTELFLKAFLRCEGFTSTQLSVQPYGHDLGALAKAARDRHLSLADDDVDLLTDSRLSASAMQTRYLSPTAANKLIIEVSLLKKTASHIRTAVLSHSSRQGKIIFQGEHA